jgi:hypothetical protein
MDTMPEVLPARVASGGFRYETVFAGTTAVSDGDGLWCPTFWI